MGGGGHANAAVIVYEKGSTAGFASLAGGATGYTIYKNGVRASSGDMRKYDVATYSSGHQLHPRVRHPDHRLL